MITLEELAKLVETEFAKDTIILNEWKKKSPLLIPHIELMPAESRITERGEEVTRWEEIEVGGFDTYDDELAYFCWKCGCGMGYVLDYWDGSPTYSVWLPRDEKEYQENLAEADKYWKEVME